MQLSCGLEVLYLRREKIFKTVINVTFIKFILKYVKHCFTFQIQDIIKIK